MFEELGSAEPVAGVGGAGKRRRRREIGSESHTIGKNTIHSRKGDQYVSRMSGKRSWDFEERINYI